MATVVDSLIIVLGLDPTKFTSGTKQVANDFLKLKEESLRTGKSLEESGARTANVFRAVRTQLLGIAAALIGARGIKEFVANTVQADDALGRTSRRINENIQSLSQWQIALRLSGGAAQDVDTSFGNIVSQIEQFKSTGDVSKFPWFAALQNMGVNISNIDTGKLEDRTKLMHELADAFKQLPTETAYEYGQNMGLTPGMINLLSQGSGLVDHYLGEAKKLGGATEQSVEAARQLAESWTKLAVVSENLGRTLVTNIVGPLTQVLDYLTNIGIAGTTAFSFAESPTYKEFRESQSHATGPMVNRHIPTPGSPERFTNLRNTIPSTNPTITGKVKGKSNPQAQEDIAAFVRMGYSKEQATGIVANLMRESSGDHNLSVIDTDKKEHYGLAQWGPDRQEIFKKAFGKDIHGSSRDDQLAFIWYELNNSEQRAKQELLKTDNVSDATKAFRKFYERPANGVNEDILRSNIGLALYNPVANASGRGVGNSNSETHTSIGTINVITKATDANGIADSIRDAMNSSLAAHAQGGMQ